ncbi:enoyl-CoA hydratase/isomerase family protein [Amorphus sp. 3PC139-8]|uniref:enoyl-CoA hydratase/isomerase family protein n=1 Tax=Amorphus sp. 3PC139-8 TaxID=2735676 RepID=UPI00345DCF40
MALVRSEVRNGATVLTLDRSKRHNALVPELLDELRAAIAEASAAEPTALVLTGAGPSFSTGGDVGGFLKAASSPEALDSYAYRTVSALHATILDLLALPCPVIAKVNGPVTGGSVGLVLAADLVAMAETAFIQPYYSEVGFSPDGGWTALLPERIGTAEALAMQVLNRRISAQEARDLRLVTTVTSAADLDGLVETWLAQIAQKSRASLAATRRLVWSGERVARVAVGLDAELHSFLAEIGTDETRAGMVRFVTKARKQAAQ